MPRRAAGRRRRGGDTKVPKLRSNVQSKSRLLASVNEEIGGLPLDAIRERPAHRFAGGRRAKRLRVVARNNGNALNGNPERGGLLRAGLEDSDTYVGIGSWRLGSTSIDENKSQSIRWTAPAIRFGTAFFRREERVTRTYERRPER